MKTSNISMQGDGYYNENSDLQRLTIEKSLTLLLPTDFKGSSITLVDYGSSEGKNSIYLLSEFLKRIYTISSATLVFNDTPFNDFSSLSLNIEASLDRLSGGGKLAINPLLSPRSYFDQVLPDSFVDIGFSFSTIHWLRSMPDESSDASSLSAAAHEDLVTFLSARFKEVRQQGTLILSIVRDGELSATNSLECLKTAAHNISSSYPVDPWITTRLPLYLRTVDEVMKSLAAVDKKWRLKNHQTVPLMHSSWSPEVEKAASHADMMAAREKYADGIAGFVLAPTCNFFLEDMKSKVKHGENPQHEELAVLKEDFIKDFRSAFKDEFLRSHCGDKIGLTYTLLELERL